MVETLIERGFNVHAINQKQMDRFRDRFTPAGAKDDSRDAEVMASAFRADPRCFRLLAAIDPVIVELRVVAYCRRPGCRAQPPHQPLARASFGATFPP